ncbi:MAG: dTDP-glucose 4,6-dehydratase [Planctomycetes bacterium]|nr:dTDP-glucose 4,6-dehydratase [Planctomycetota bacterium]
MTILVTGGAGFIGSHLTRHLLALGRGHRVVVVDALTYAGNLENLEGLEGRADYRFVRADIAERPAMERVFAEERPEGVVHLAAESHVDRSSLDSGPFVRTHVLGTQVLLDVARGAGVSRFLQVSTDEVYGSLGPTGSFTEESPLAPSSPYSASKAAADLLALSYWETFRLPVLVTRSSNNYGPRQFPEKLIPLMIVNALEGRPLPVYGDGRNVRDWIHVEDHSRAILEVLERGRPGEVYNVGASSERANIEIVRFLLRVLDRDESSIQFVKDRPGHDRRYAIDAGKLRRELGWEPVRRFEEALRDTVRWYLENRGWWEGVRSGDYLLYYQRQYGER